mmetsp:Transcript_79754/g.237573  ORF Transcript_79754/g.237573 Transcript_79754/m.237573 type:complete len:379 (-) Transcript_79754:1022-2158(-)
MQQVTKGLTIPGDKADERATKYRHPRAAAAHRAGGQQDGPQVRNRTEVLRVVRVEGGYRGAAHLLERVHHPRPEPALGTRSKCHRGNGRREIQEAAALCRVLGRILAQIVLVGEPPGRHGARATTPLGGVAVEQGAPPEGAAAAGAGAGLPSSHSEDALALAVRRDVRATHDPGDAQQVAEHRLERRVQQLRGAPPPLHDVRDRQGLPVAQGLDAGDPAGEGVAGRALRGDDLLQRPREVRGLVDVVPRRVRARPREGAHAVDRKDKVLVSAADGRLGGLELVAHRRHRVDAGQQHSDEEQRNRPHGHGILVAAPAPPGHRDRLRPADDVPETDGRHRGIHELVNLQDESQRDRIEQQVSHVHGLHDEHGAGVGQPAG